MAERHPRCQVAHGAEMAATMNKEKVANAVYGAMVRANAGLKVVKKGDSTLMKLVGICIRPFNPTFMTQYATTIPFLGTVYVPDDWDPLDQWDTLAHEAVHAIQGRRDGQVRFALRYLFPQCLSLLSLAAIGAIWWTPMLFALVFLLAAAPWPASKRSEYEREAYRISYAMDHLAGYDIESDGYIAWAAEHFAGWGYYKMDWSRDRAEGQVLWDISRAIILCRGNIKIDASPYELDVIQSVKKAMEEQ